MNREKERRGGAHRVEVCVALRATHHPVAVQIRDPAVELLGIELHRHPGRRRRDEPWRGGLWAATVQRRLPRAHKRASKGWAHVSFCPSDSTASLRLRAEVPTGQRTLMAVPRSQ
jgi:hypothetical protein